MAVTWDKALFDQAYESSGEPGGHPGTRSDIRLHYHRYACYAEAQRRARFYVQHFGLTDASAVLVVGCGFGWTVEALSGLGVKCIGTDVSAYVHQHKDTSEDEELAAAIAAAGLSYTHGEGLSHFNRLRGDGVRTRAAILNEDHGSTASRERVRQAFAGAAVTLAISEDVLTSLSDAEGAQLRAVMAHYGAPICHFVTELADPSAPFGFNSKTLAAWQAAFPDDTLVAEGNPYRVA